MLLQRHHTLPQELRHHHLPCEALLLQEGDSLHEGLHRLAPAQARTTPHRRDLLWLLGGELKQCHDAPADVYVHPVAAEVLQPPVTAMEIMSPDTLGSRRKETQPLMSGELTQRL